MKYIIVSLLATCLLPGYAQTEENREKHFNVVKGVAMEGYDPVSYFNGKPKEGDPGRKYTYKGVTYMFFSQENLSTFKSTPEKYEPAYGGWCAYAMGESGEKVKIDPKTYKITDGKLYLFYNFWGNNTLTAWNKNEKKLMEMGNRNWGSLIKDK